MLPSLKTQFTNNVIKILSYGKRIYDLQTLNPFVPSQRRAGEVCCRRLESCFKAPARGDAPFMSRFELKFTLFHWTTAEMYS
jgi:hypothetical protein